MGNSWRSREILTPVLNWLMGFAWICMDFTSTCQHLMRFMVNIGQEMSGVESLLCF